MLTFLGGFLRRVQLFFFAFSLAAGSMMLAGMASGKLERGEVYVSLSENFATILAEYAPSFAEQFADGDVTDFDARNGVVYGDAQAVTLIEKPTIRSVNEPGSSLRALRLRQQGQPPEHR